MTKKTRLLLAIALIVVVVYFIVLPLIEMVSMKNHMTKGGARQVETIKLK